MNATATAEAAILDILSDEDDEFCLNDALTVLVNVAAGICCQARDPHETAFKFGARLQQVVGRQALAEELARRGRLLS